MVNPSDKYLKIFSKVLGSSSSEPMSLYPNKPGKIKEIEVEPVAPTMANTNANDFNVMASVYAVIDRKSVV